MKLKELFKKNRYITLNENNTVNKPINSEKPQVPSGMWIKCNNCGASIYSNDLQDNSHVCKLCNYNFRLGAKDRIDMIADKGSVVEFNENITSVNPLDYPGYMEKIEKLKDKTGLNEAVVTVTCKINGKYTNLAVMDSNFIMASMGSAVGEKITRAIEKSIEFRIPLIIFTASGGARMQEGMYSLLQMAKTTSALAKLNQEGILYVSVLTDPTTGGVTASFASVADIILAEPGATIGFAGRRVIENTIKQELPDEFQKSEFLLKKGFVDKIVKRQDLKAVLGDILELHKE
ncbi:MAG: acetyl-CoA carboxylase, carboxyltransferase subunit beta [Clostridiaceae bacterium]